MIDMEFYLSPIFNEPDAQLGLACINELGVPTSGLISK